MSNSAMPNLPGFGAITENMELMRKMWGGTGAPGMGFPGMTAPTLSVEDIKKQIADLKAVESWLTLNMNMLRGTIQALEVQSATILALKSMGEAFKNAGKVPAAANKSATGFSFPFASPSQTQSSESTQSTASASTQQEHPAMPFAPDLMASLADPSIWWNMLQGQFKQALSAAETQSGDETRSSETAPNDASADTARSHPPASAPSAAKEQAVTQAVSEGDLHADSAAAELPASSTAKRVVKASAKPPTP